jgi:hypothetical protein
MSLHTGLNQIRAPEMPFFSIGGIIGRSLWIALWNFVSFVLMTLELAVPLIAYVVAVSYFTGDLSFHNFQIGSAYAALERTSLVYGRFQGEGPVDFTVAAILWILLVFTFFAPPAAIAQRAFQSMLGRSASFYNCIQLTLAALPRVVIFAIFMFASYGIVALALGYLFFHIAWPGLPIVPTFIIAVLAIVATMFLNVVWWVGIPVLMVEWTGPLVALRRSWILTSGKRWQIVAILVLLALANTVIQFILARFMPTDLAAESAQILAYVLTAASVVVGVFFYFTGAVAAAVGYFHLAGEKEGILAIDRVFVGSAFY